MRYWGLIGAPVECGCPPVVTWCKRPILSTCSSPRTSLDEGGLTDEMTARSLILKVHIVSTFNSPFPPPICSPVYSLTNLILDLIFYPQTTYVAMPSAVSSPKSTLGKHVPNGVVPGQDAIRGFIDLLNRCTVEEGFGALTGLQEENEELKRQNAEFKATSKGNSVLLAEENKKSKSLSEQLAEAAEVNQALKDELDQEKTAHSDKRKRLEGTTRDINDLMEQSKLAESEIRKLKEDKKAEAEQITQVNADLEDTRRQLKSAQMELKDKDAEIEELQKQLDNIQRFSVALRPIQDAKQKV